MKNYKIIDGVIYIDGVAQCAHPEAVKELMRDYEDAVASKEVADTLVENLEKELSKVGNYVSRRRMKIWCDMYKTAGTDAKYREDHANKAVDAFDKKFGES